MIRKKEIVIPITTPPFMELKETKTVQKSSKTRIGKIIDTLNRKNHISAQVKKGYTINALKNMCNC